MLHYHYLLEHFCVEFKQHEFLSQHFACILLKLEKVYNFKISALGTPTYALRTLWMGGGHFKNLDCFGIIEVI